MFVFRDVSPEDLDDLQAAARHLDSVNLPDDADRLRRLIALSCQSFAGEIDVAARRFVFVAAEIDPATGTAAVAAGGGGGRDARGHVVGTSTIFAQHGSRRSPHVYFDVFQEERYSDTLDKHLTHQLLRIGYNYKGLTAIGGLVLQPD